jgi:hypothetical protein
MGALQICPSLDGPLVSQGRMAGVGIYSLRHNLKRRVFYKENKIDYSVKNRVMSKEVNRWDWWQL